MMWTVIKKELRGYFHSPIALIFIATFLAITLIKVFWYDKIFARGLADVRPLFESMPLLLLVLVSGLSMRMWADERRAGTLELLLTLPIARWKLVLGKFFAGMILIAIALALTLGLPLTIASMGDLDWGPVIGGYLATLLLAAAYLAIGMCISAVTDNTVVALFGTALACGLPYGVSWLEKLGDGGGRLLRGLGELGRLLGTDARFDSIARGVLDIRDLAYYAAMILIGLAVNVLLIGRLAWSKGPRTRPRRHGALLAAGLIAANAIALNLWLAPVQRARIDLTEDGAYSLSNTTEKLLSRLDEKLVIKGYFSGKTAPVLQPLVPQLRDLLAEYGAVGGDKVRVQIVDPTDDDAVKREAKERFDIEPTPLPFETADEQSVVNTYFAIAIEYGDQHAVLGLDDLVQVRMRDIGKVDVSLKNPEYQITKAIKKAATSFQSIDALFASLPGKVKLTAYLTPKTLPENWKDAPEKLKKVVDDLTKESGGKLEYKNVEPAPEQMEELYRKYGLRPYAADLMSGKVYYFHLLLEVGDRIVRIVPPDNLGDAGLKTSLTEGLKRAAPGFTRVIGLWTPPPPPARMPSMQGMPPQEMPPPQTFETLKRALGGDYEVRDVRLGARVPEDVEVLVLCGPANLHPKEVEDIDQFVMRGGSLVVLAGRYRLAPAEGIAVEKVTTGLEALFAKWGVTVVDELVLDPEADKFPIPRNRDLGNGMMIREMQPILYPFFVKLVGDRVGSSVITGGLAGSVMHFVSPIKAEAKVGDDAHRVEVLLRSSSESWLSSSLDVAPDPRGYAKPSGLAADKQGSQPVAVAITGGFASGVAKSPPDPATPPDPASPPVRLLEHSPPDARIVVFGSSAFVSDDILRFAQQHRSDLALSNVGLVHNAVDWSLADTDLLAIRSHDTAARAITLAADKRGKWRFINLAIAGIALALLTGLAFLQRRAVEPVVFGPKEDA